MLSNGTGDIGLAGAGWTLQNHLPLISHHVVEFFEPVQAVVTGDVQFRGEVLERQLPWLRGRRVVRTCVGVGSVRSGLIPALTDPVCRRFHGFVGEPQDIRLPGLQVPATFDHLRFLQAEEVIREPCDLVPGRNLPRQLLHGSDEEIHPVEVRQVVLAGRRRLRRAIPAGQPLHRRDGRGDAHRIIPGTRQHRGHLLQEIVPLLGLHRRQVRHSDPLCNPVDEQPRAQVIQLVQQCVQSRRVLVRTSRELGVLTEQPGQQRRKLVG